MICFEKYILKEVPNIFHSYFFLNSFKGLHNFRIVLFIKDNVWSILGTKNNEINYWIPNLRIIKHCY